MLIMSASPDLVEGAKPERSRRLSWKKVVASVGAIAVGTIAWALAVSSVDTTEFFDDSPPPSAPVFDCHNTHPVPYVLEGHQTPYDLYLVADPRKLCDPGIIFAAFAADRNNDDTPLGTMAQEPKGTVIELPFVDNYPQPTPQN